MGFKKVSEINRGDLPRKNGVYFFRIVKGVDFYKFKNLENQRIVYIGRAIKTDNIFKRFGDHIENSKGRTSSSGSTLRRSIGSIFKKRWSLKGYPRIGSDNKPNHVSNFNFISLNIIEEEDLIIYDYKKEEKLTDWMKNNLEFCYIESENAKALEKELVSRYKPTLNDDKCNPLKEKLFDELRPVCRKEAKEYSLKNFGFIPKY